MAITKKQTKSKGSWGIITLGCLLVIGTFIGIFLTSNNVKLSFVNTATQEKYPAEAFVKKRKSATGSSRKGTKSSVGITTNDGFNADVVFDSKNQKVRLVVRDRFDKPVPRVQVIGTISKAGGKGRRQFKLNERKKGDFRSQPLNLSNGNWVLTVSAYDYDNRRESKLMFHTERPIRVEQKN